MLTTISRQLRLWIWPPLPLCYRLYRMALWVGLFGCAQTLVLRQPEFPEVNLWIFCILVSAGFVVWIAQLALRIFHHRLSKALLTALHAGVLIAGFICSRWCVALAVGLPAKDFDASVAVITVVCAGLIYIALAGVASIVIASACSMLAPVLESAWIVSRLPWTTRLHEYLSTRLGVTIFEQPESGATSTKLNIALHFGGGFLVAYFCFCAFKIATDASINDAQLMKHLVYFADYHWGARYPGIPSGERFVLHDNNVISLARLVDGRVEIAVGIIDPQKGITAISPYE